MGATKIHTFVIYPTLAGTAPVVVVTANQGLSDWVRAVGTEVVRQGYIAVVPDLLSGLGPNGGGSFSFASDEAVAAALGQLGASEVQRRTQAVRDYFVEPARLERQERGPRLQLAAKASSMSRSTRPRNIASSSLI